MDELVQIPQKPDCSLETKDGYLVRSNISICKAILKPLVTVHGLIIFSSGVSIALHTLRVFSNRHASPIRGGSCGVCC